MVAATVSATSAAPIGKPPPSALADRDQVRRQAERPEREHRAGAAEAALDLVGDEQRAGPLAGLLDGPASAGDIGRTPPSPWIGSTMIAAVFVVTSRSSADGSSVGAKETPASSGWNGSR